MVILTYEYLLNHLKIRKWIYRLGFISFVLLLYGRVGLAYEPFFPVVYETHGNKDWVNKLKSEVGDIPVVFENSYRKSPMYQFYSGGIPTFSLNNIFYRQNQYTIDDSEAKVQGKKVAYVSPYLKKGDFEYQNINGSLFKGIYIENFQSFRKLRCYINEDKVRLPAKDIILKIHNPYEIDIPLEKIKLRIGYLNHYKQLKEVLDVVYQPINKGTSALKSKEYTSFIISLPQPTLSDIEHFKFSISENGLPSGINSQTYKVEH